MATRTDRPGIVVLGGGFGGLEAAFYLRNRLGRRADLTLVSDSDEFLFKPNTIYVPFGKDPERYVVKLPAILDGRHIHFLRARVEGVDPGARRVATSEGHVAYDHLIVATGAAMRPAEVPGLAENASGIWTPGEMLRLRQALERGVAAAQAGRAQRVQFVVPPNNKCAGPLYEMVLMLDTWLRRRRVRERFTLGLATYERSYIQAFGPRLHEVVSGELSRRGIRGQTGKRLAAVQPSLARFDDGDTLSFDLLVGFAPYVAAVRYPGLPADDRGFLTTDLATRQVLGHPDLYAVGDAGDFPVKQAFLALLQADAAAEHLSQRILGEATTARFDPVSMCILEQLDRATFAQVPLRVTRDAERPVAVREEDRELYRVGTGELWRAGKKLLGTAIPGRFRQGQPFHAGASWAVLESGVKVMASLFAD